MKSVVNSLKIIISILAFQIIFSSLAQASNKPLPRATKPMLNTIKILAANLNIQEATGAFENLQELYLEESLVLNRSGDNKDFHHFSVVQLNMNGEKLNLEVSESKTDACGIRTIKAMYSVNDLQNYGLLKFQLLLKDMRKNTCDTVHLYPVQAQLSMSAERSISHFVANGFIAE